MKSASIARIAREDAAHHFFALPATEARRRWLHRTALRPIIGFLAESLVMLNFRITGHGVLARRR